MKRVIIIILILLLFVSGCGQNTNTDAGKEDILETGNVEINKTKDNYNVADKTEEIIKWNTTILNTGQEIKCIGYVQNTRTFYNTSIIIWIKNNKERIDINRINEPDEISNYIYDGYQLYAWAPSLKLGNILNSEKIKKVTEVEYPDIYALNMQMFDSIICKKEIVPDSIFTIPKDVEFVDLADALLLLKNQSSVRR